MTQTEFIFLLIAGAVPILLIIGIFAWKAYGFPHNPAAFHYYDHDTAKVVGVTPEQADAIKKLMAHGMTFANAYSMIMNVEKK